MDIYIINIKIAEKVKNIKKLKEDKKIKNIQKKKNVIVFIYIFKIY